MDQRLKTPRRYRSSRYNPRSERFWNLVRLGIFLLTLAFVGLLVYQQRSLMGGVMDDVQQEVQTQRENLMPIVPTATPFIDVVGASNNAERAYRSGDYDAAIDNYRRVAQGRPNDVGVYARLGYLLILTSDLGNDATKLEEALEVAERTINADPESTEGWKVKAMALLWQGREAEAQSYAARALELVPTDSLARALLAQAFWEAGDPDRADEEMKRAISDLQAAGAADEETIALVYRTQGWIYLQKLEWESAIESYQRAISAAPNYGFLVAELSLTYIGLDQAPTALQLLEQKLEENPRDTLALFYSGIAYTNLNDFEAAMEMFQQCVQIERENLDCLEWLGGTYYYTQQYTDAVSILQQATQLGLRSPEVWWQLGDAYYWLSQCNLAIPVLRDGYQIAVEEEDDKFRDKIEQSLQNCGVTLEDSD